MSISATLPTNSGALTNLELQAKSKSAGSNADTFLQLFTTQIANQDPMDPMNSADFLNQFSQITQVQTMTGMQTSLTGLQNALTSLSNSSEQSQASSLLGNTVQYTDSSGVTKSGSVDAIMLQSGGGASLLVNGTTISLDSVTKVSNTATTTAPVSGQ